MERLSGFINDFKAKTVHEWNCQLTRNTTIKVIGFKPGMWWPWAGMHLAFRDFVCVHPQSYV